MNLALEIDKETIDEVLTASTKEINMEEASAALERMRQLLKGTKAYDTFIGAVKVLFELGEGVENEGAKKKLQEIAIKSTFGCGVDAGLRMAQRFLEKQEQDAPEPSDMESLLGQTKL